MGACAVLEAFFSKGTGARRATSGSQALGDTEIVSQDVRDIEEAGASLQTQLRELPDGGSVSVEGAKEACRKVAVFDIPSSVLAATDPNIEPDSVPSL